MKRFRVLSLALPALALASTAQAQTGMGGPTTNHPAIERYNRTAKGANVEEWKRRLGEEEDLRTRLDAVESLGTKGGDEAIRPLIEATADADYRVRIRAIDYLGALRALEATPVLMQLLFLSDVGREEKLRVLSSLGRIADPATTERLIAYARTIQDPDLACRAVFALGEIADPNSVKGLESLKNSHPGSDLDRLVDDAVAKIALAQKSLPSAQPTLIELEQKLARQQQKAEEAAGR